MDRYCSSTTSSSNNTNNITKAIKRKADGKPHMDVGFRTADGRYICRICGRKFANRFSLTGHYKSHYEYHEKPYSCPDCGLRYTSPSNLHHHRAKKCCILKLKNMLNGTTTKTPHGKQHQQQQTDMTYLVQKAIKVIERRNWLSKKVTETSDTGNNNSNNKSIYKSNSLLRSFAIKELIEIITGGGGPPPQQSLPITQTSTTMNLLDTSSSEEDVVEEDDGLQPIPLLKFSIRALDVEAKPLDLSTQQQ